MNHLTYRQPAKDSASGCAFDQQMIHENGGDLLKAAARRCTVDTTILDGLTLVDKSNGDTQP